MQLPTPYARPVLLTTSNVSRGFQPASGIALRAFSAGGVIAASVADVISMIAGRCGRPRRLLTPALPSPERGAPLRCATQAQAAEPTPRDWITTWRAPRRVVSLEREVLVVAVVHGRLPRHI